MNSYTPTPDEMARVQSALGGAQQPAPMPADTQGFVAFPQANAPPPVAAPAPMPPPAEMVSTPVIQRPPDAGLPPILPNGVPSSMVRAPALPSGGLTPEQTASVHTALGLAPPASTTSVATARKGYEAARSNTDTTIEHQMAASGDEAKAQVAQSDTMAGFYDREAKRQEALAQVDQLKTRVHQDALDSFAKQTADLERSHSEETMAPLYAHPSTAQRIGFILGGMLGGMDAGVNGGPNKFLQKIEGNVRQDLEVQKENYARRGAGIASRHGEYARMVGVLGDEKLADNMYFQRALEASKAQAQSLMMSSDSPIIRARGEKVVATIDESLKQRKEQYQGLLMQNAQATANAWAAAQTAMVDKLWGRSVEAKKLEQEDRKITIEGQKVQVEGQKAMAEGGKATNAASQKYADDLQATGVPTANAAIRDADGLVGNLKPGESLPPGLGSVDSAIYNLPAGGPQILGALERYTPFVGTGATRNAATMQNLGLQVTHMLMGNRINPHVAESIGNMIAGARTPEDYQHGLNLARQVVAARQQNTAAGNPEGAAAYGANRAAGGLRDAPGAIQGNVPTQQRVPLAGDK